MTAKRSLLTLAAALCLALLLAFPAAAYEVISEEQAALDLGDAILDNFLTSTEVVYIGDVSTQVGTSWECDKSYSLSSSVKKQYETMVGNVLRVTLYTPIPEDDNAFFYIAYDRHISYPDGTDRFTYMGQRGGYYYYQKTIRITTGGTFTLTVGNANNALYKSIYDTMIVTAYDKIESLDFFAEESIEEAGVTTFFVTANNSDTALITPDTTGFNATDNEWKMITAEKTERVIFDDTVYAGYTFEPDTISLRVTAPREETEEPVEFQVYYLGLINGRLITVGPYDYAANTGLYSDTFELARDRVDVLASEKTMTFTAYIESGCQPSVTVTDTLNLTTLQKVEVLGPVGDGRDEIAITVDFVGTFFNLELLIGNRWNVGRTAYNYRTLKVNFLRDIQSLALTAQQNGHYQVSYAATVNGQHDLDTTAVNWYINGIMQPEHGLTLERTYTEGGHYAVYAELDGLQSNTVENSIIYSNWQANFWYITMAVVLLLGMMLVFVKIRNNGSRMDARLRRRLIDLQRENDQLHAALVQGKYEPRRIAWSMQRRIPTLLRMNYDLLGRYNVTNLTPYRNAEGALAAAVLRLRDASFKKTADPYYTRALLDNYRKDLAAAQHALHEIIQLTLRG